MSGRLLLALALLGCGGDPAGLTITDAPYAGELVLDDPGMEPAGEVTFAFAFEEGRIGPITYDPWPQCWSGTVIEACDPCSRACAAHGGIETICQEEPESEFEIGPLFCRCADGTESPLGRR